MFNSKTPSYGRHPIRLVMSVINKRAALEIEVIELNKKQAILFFWEYILNKLVYRLDGMENNFSC